MKRIPLIYGTDTGDTLDIAEKIRDLMDGFAEIELIDISDFPDDEFDSSDFLILAQPTWYDGELQSDWEDYWDSFLERDFDNKKVALFGLGDQVGYPEYFVDALGLMRDVIHDAGGETICHMSADGFDFESSKAFNEAENTFCGLVLDNDNQSELHEERISEWVELLVKELNNG